MERQDASDVMLPLYTNRCLCLSCDYYFSSLSSFVKHQREDKCLTPDEMEAEGMFMNDDGYWVSGKYENPHWEKEECNEYVEPEAPKPQKKGNPWLM